MDDNGDGRRVEGTPFGKYRLVALLGRGGMGEVWRAFDTETDRIVALKVLPARSADDETFKERFRREARAAAGLYEPHVVPIHGFGEVDGRLYVDMRLIVGRDLDAVLGAGPLDPARAVMIVEQVASALDAAHQIGLVHRDVKPSNILLAEDDFAYLIDFGIAKAVGETGLTNTGATIGTWAYLAPERFTTTAEADSSSDVYALACVLYHCLTGQMPYPGTGIEHFYHGHVYGEIPKATTKNAEISAAMDTVIATGMAKDPDQRYPTTRELAQAARAALTGTAEPIARPTPVPAPAPQTPPAEPLPQGAITGSSSSAASDTGARTSSVDAIPKDSGAEVLPSHPALEVANDPAADTRTQAGVTVSASDAPTQQAPVSTGNDGLAEARSAERVTQPVERPFWERLSRRTKTLGGAVAAVVAGSVVVTVIITQQHDGERQPSRSNPQISSQISTSTSARASGPNETLGDYFTKNNIQETPVGHNTPGAPTINLPVPDGWSQLPESENAPYGGLKLNAPADPADPVTFAVLVEKLTGNVNTDQLLAASVGDLKNQKDYDGSDGQKSTLGGFPAYQILGTYTTDGAKRVGAQKTVVIQGKDGIYLLLLRGRGLEGDMNAITDATNVIDQKTTITP